MAFKPALPEEQKKRAAHLKAQGWATADVAKDTGLLDATINANWRDWARRYGIELPASGPDKPQQAAGTSNLVTSYRVDPATGEQLTEPVTEAVELPAKSMPSDIADTLQGEGFRGALQREAQLAQAKKQARKKAPAASKLEAGPVQEPEPARPEPIRKLPKAANACGFLDKLNRLLWGYIKTNSLPQSECYYNVELAEGILSVRIALPAGEEDQVELHIADLRATYLDEERPE